MPALLCSVFAGEDCFVRFVSCFVVDVALYIGTCQLGRYQSQREKAALRVQGGLGRYVLLAVQGFCGDLLDTLQLRIICMYARRSYTALSLLPVHKYDMWCGRVSVW